MRPTEAAAEGTRRKLLEFARRAEALEAEADRKLQGVEQEIKGLLKAGFRPVVFCRFVDTADYVARRLRDTLPAKVRVESVTGLLPPSEREARIERLTAESGEYVLVCTDCLSEGINLQAAFDAVLHYDLTWNPTRHEQREGRVDRFGQKKREVRVVTYYGTDNPIDGVILDVLIRKHKSIKSALGVTVAVPGSSEQIAEALFEGALFRERSRAGGAQLPFDFLADVEPKRQAVHAEWENARDREKASRSRCAQHTLSPDVVAAELKGVRAAIGSSQDVAGFVKGVLGAAKVPVEVKGNAVTVHLDDGTPRALRQAIGRDESFAGGFELPLEEGDVYLGRTSPIVEGLAGWVLDQALDPVARDAAPVAARCGVIATSGVTARTTLLVARFRFHLQTGKADGDTMLCEEILPLACTGQADAPVWLGAEDDARSHPELAANGAVADLGVVAYAGVPLTISTGETLGSFCAIDKRPRAWTDREIAILTDLAAVAVTEIELRIAARESRERAARRVLAQQQASALLVENVAFAAAASRLVETVGEALGWKFAAMWSAGDDPDVLRCRASWVASDAYRDYASLSGEIGFKKGKRWPGIVWASGQPHWTVDITRDSQAPRARTAAAAGLHGGAFVPIWREQQIIGVFEFVSDRLEPPDTPLLETLALIGRDFGNYLERCAAEDQLRRSDALKAAILSTAMDCVITMSHDGAVREWNPAAERTFGYARSEVIGRSMAELIIPPSLRERHARGLAGYLAGGDGPGAPAPSCHGRASRTSGGARTTTANSCWESAVLLSPDDHRLCEPLTCEALATTQEKFAFTVFERTFKDFGLAQS